MITTRTYWIIQTPSSSSSPAQAATYGRPGDRNNTGPCERVPATTNNKAPRASSQTAAGRSSPADVLSLAAESTSKATAATWLALVVAGALNQLARQLPRGWSRRTFHALMSPVAWSSHSRPLRGCTWSATTGTATSANGIGALAWATTNSLAVGKVAGGPKCPSCNGNAARGTLSPSQPTRTRHHQPATPPECRRAATSVHGMMAPASSRHRFRPCTRRMATPCCEEASRRLFPNDHNARLSPSSAPHKQRSSKLVTFALFSASASTGHTDGDAQRAVAPGG
eukprot:TRINITY_DN11539_c0_g1_i3.p1 TRINITY_DN11539_c0_g1~~TRINITY_DN11539_c0_g1_i3.p1  ORF type:complete len:283 (-),score=11.47 TRINITY_DN11539_c0_g1_i3:411-1259(-)